jgi:hypothetical protein
VPYVRNAGILRKLRGDRLRLTGCHGRLGDTSRWISVVLAGSHVEVMFSRMMLFSSVKGAMIASLLLIRLVLKYPPLEVRN